MVHLLVELMREGMGELTVVDEAGDSQVVAGEESDDLVVCEV